MSYDEQKRRPGRHHIWFAEMDLDYCRLRYGEGACPAVLGEDSEQKCFNTEATCPVPRAFDPVPKTYRFMQAVENAPIGAGAVPNLTGVSLTPGKIEVGGGLGSRSVVDLTFSDHPGSDIGIDKYLFERGIDQGITSVVNLASAASGSGSLPASAAWALGPILPAAVELVGEPINAPMRRQESDDFTLEAWVNLPADEDATLFQSEGGSFAVTVESSGILSVRYDVFDDVESHEEIYQTDGIETFFPFPYEDPGVWIFLNNTQVPPGSIFTYEVGVGVTSFIALPQGLELKIVTAGDITVPEASSFRVGFPRDRWVHVTVRRDSGVLTTLLDGVPVEDDMTFYADFVDDEYYLSQEPTGRDLAPWSITQLGAMTGRISDVRIWAVARSDLQIQLSHRKKITGQEAGLAAYWPLDDAWHQARDYDPLAQGTFWGKFRARNPYYQNRPVRVWSGYIENPNDISTFDFDNSQRRDYLLETITGPDSNGRVRVTGKDPLKMADNDRAQAPRPSRGWLSADIGQGNNITLDLEVPTGIDINDEYPANGYACIGSEVMHFNRSGKTIQLSQRGYHNTEISDHDEGDAFQLCLKIDNTTVGKIDRQLLVEYAGVPEKYIPSVDWDEEIAEVLPFGYSALITEPVGVRELLKELGEQAPHYLFWDERINQIKLHAVKPPSSSAPIYNDREHFIEGSLTPGDDPKRRASLVVVNFAQIDPTRNLDEASNFRATYARANLERERQYGGQKIKTINSRWMDRRGRDAAEHAAAFIGRRFGATPRTLRSSLDAKDSELWTGDVFIAETRHIQGPTGLANQTPFQVLSVKEADDGRYQYEALEYQFDPPSPDDPQGDEYPVSFDTDRNNINIRDEYLGRPGYPSTPDKPVHVKVKANTIIGSNSYEQWAMTTGFWPEGTPPIIIELEAPTSKILGRGGAGGPGLSENIGDAFPPAQDGVEGGPALNADHPVILINNGLIAGGGGGGGGAGGRSSITIFPPCGGGGGAGRSEGAGGVARAGTIVPPDQRRPGESGSVTSGGVGGQSEGDWRGGAGGGPGQPGKDATGLDNLALFLGAGGPAGNSIDGVGKVTFDVEGDIRGPRSN